jgi:ADP-ribosylglycohydrolase
MLGAIAGDVVGSLYEFDPIKTKDFTLFPSEPPRAFATDDSILTVVVADCLLHDKPYVPAFHAAVETYPRATWGTGFRNWAVARRTQPYHSWGNGSAMRVSPVGWACHTVERVLAEAERSAAVTHDHPEGIRGAQATALAVFLARTGHDKSAIRDEITARFGYDLARSVDEVRPSYGFDESCQRTVPEALICFLDGADFEDTVRNAVSLGGDADTLACIAGAVAEAFWGGVPEPIAKAALDALPAALRPVVGEFMERHSIPRAG